MSVDVKKVKSDNQDLVQSYTIENGLVVCAKYVESSNYNERPEHTEIDLLVIHCASMPYGEYDNNNLEKLFSGTLESEKLKQFGLAEDLRVSVHLYINRQGDIFQFVPLHKRAWHAGVSEFEGRQECNHYSIGIELQGTIESDFTKDQYKALIDVTKTLKTQYPGITNHRIVGHSDIAPHRKSDPGEGFDWDYYLSSV